MIRKIGGFICPSASFNPQNYATHFYFAAEWNSILHIF